MNTFTRFLYEFLSQFFSGIVIFFKGIKEGIASMFNITKYAEILGEYKEDLSISEYILVIIAIMCIILLVLSIIALIYFFIRKYIKITKKALEQENLISEIAELDNKVADLVKEKEEILSMKVSQLGLGANESNTIENSESRCY